MFMPLSESVISDAMHVLRAILTAGLFMSGSYAQCQLFDKSEIEYGGTFNLICDVSHIGSVPTAVTEIYYLTIERTVPSSAQVTTVAMYLLNPSEELEKTIPKGRAWVIKASGGKVPSQLDNRASIKLTLLVPDAKCSDAGLYICNAGFRPNNGISVSSCSQNMTFKGPCSTGTRLGVVDSTRFVLNIFLVQTVMFLWPSFL